MKLIDTVLLSASVGFFVIGVNQVFAGKDFYWIFMLSLVFLFSYQIRKLQRKEKKIVEQPKTASSTPKQKKSFANSNYTKKKKRRK